MGGSSSDKTSAKPTAKPASTPKNKASNNLSSDGRGGGSKHTDNNIFAYSETIGKWEHALKRARRPESPPAHHAAWPARSVYPAHLPSG
eukprot:COSAG04_NODE_238_length_19079_cov_9.187039_12_plen_89_part_00